MTLDRALEENPYNRERGKVGAYIRYLRYNVDGWYNRKSADIRKELADREILREEHDENGKGITNFI
ncbi:MAG: hypothetical protein HFI99_16410 [Lachnospiraceae bacterium]|jgi:hypothetical protein|nr:hypothetical protein [Lachnospiraceae bacterium]